MALAEAQDSHQSKTHDFHALRGVQGGRPCYTIMCPLRLIPRLFQYDYAELPPEQRAQRTVNLGRVPEITSYLIENSQDYVLPAITASLDQEAVFEPAGNGDVAMMGLLKIPREARLLINDGQHRRAAIERAIVKKRELGHDSVPVLLFIDEGLKRSQQMFADLNRHAIRPSTSLNTLYDKRDAASELARAVTENVSCFHALTEVEKSSLPLHSRKLFTLSSIKSASWRYLEKRKRDQASLEEHQQCIVFWEGVCSVMPEWEKAITYCSLPTHLRQETIHAHGVFLQAMATACAPLREHPEAKTALWFEEKLKPLIKENWQRTNPEWEGRCLRDGRISKSHTSVELLASYIRRKLGIPLSDKQWQLEEQYRT